MAVDARRDRAFVKDGYELARCPSCGLLARRELPRSAELTSIYGDDYFRDDSADRSDGYADYLGDEALHRDTARRRVALLQRHGGTPGRLLDVGSACGFFVDEAAMHGWTATGVDISPSMVSWGHSHLGVPLELGTVESVAIEPGTLDAVTMWDYLEHSLDPDAELRHCLRLLRPGGLLALSTGDVDSIAARLSGRRWHLLTPRHHNYFFGRRTLLLLLQRVGFEVLAVRHPGARYSIRHLLYKLGRMARTRAIAVPAERLGRSRLGALALPVNLFDIVTVVARKPDETSLEAVA
jgi:SAM-dependent methyltransferase